VSIIFSYLRLILFLGGMLIGIQLPMFVDQYGKSLQAHFIESDNSLNEFRDEAATFFDGDIEKLISHYRASPDRVFQAGGGSIENIYRRYQILKRALAEFNTGSWQAYAQALFQPVTDIQREVRDSYSYAVKLDSEAIVFGLACGLIASVLVESVLHILGGVVVRLTRKPRSMRQRQPPRH